MDGRQVAPLMGDYKASDVGTLRMRTLPNFWNHSSCDHGVSTRLLPAGPQRTAIRVYWLVDEKAEEGRDYELTPGTKVHILPRDVPVAIAASLRANGPQRTETQRFITDRFDRFLFTVSQLQAAVRSGLVRLDDVRFPLEWYVEKRICRHKKLLLAYMAENSTIESTQFFESLEAWRRCQ